MGLGPQKNGGVLEVSSPNRLYIVTLTGWFGSILVDFVEAQQLDADITRTELHYRRIDMRGYQRSDGLFEVEGQVVDRKPYDFCVIGSQKVSANEAIHDMGVRLIFDEELLVHDIQTFTRASPYAHCAEGGYALKSIIGLSIGAGWSKEIRSRLGGARSCAHLAELLIPMATTAIQSLGLLNRDKPDQLDINGRPKKIDSCYAYGAGQELVLRRWPEFFQHSSKV